MVLACFCIPVSIFHFFLVNVRGVLLLLRYARKIGCQWITTYRCTADPVGLAIPGESSLSKRSVPKKIV